MIAKRKIMFVDETSFQAWSTPKQDKTWQAPNQPIQRTVNTKGLGSVTIFGGCSNFMEPLQFMIGSTTDQTNWVTFLGTIREELDKRHITGKIVIVADNLSAHHGVWARQFYQRFEFLFMPAYSCVVNR